MGLLSHTSTFPVGPSSVQTFPRILYVTISLKNRILIELSVQLVSGGPLNIGSFGIVKVYTVV